MTTTNEKNDLTKLLEDIITREPPYSKEKNGIHIHEIFSEGKTICEKSQALEYVLWPPKDENIETVYFMLIGETGKGKTTLINGILNFILGVDCHHKFRLAVPVYNASDNKKNETDSQTELLTLYKLPYVDGMAHRNNLVLIDTPGVLDTHGPAYEILNMNRMKLFLKEHISMESNFTGIVAEANLTNNPGLESLINGIKRIVDEQSTKTILIATFADATTPKAFSLLEKLDMKFHTKVQINNGFLYTSNVDDLQEKWNEWKDQITDLLACITQPRKDNLGITFSVEDMDQLNCILMKRLDLEKTNNENTDTELMKTLKGLVKICTSKGNQNLQETSTDDSEENFHQDDMKEKEEEAKMDVVHLNCNARDKIEISSSKDMNESTNTSKVTFKLRCEEYNEQLGDNTTTEFALMRRAVEIPIGAAFKRNSFTNFLKYEMKRLLRGSIIVISEITTREEAGIVDIELLTKTIKESGVKGLDPSSVTVNGTQAIHVIAYIGRLDMLKHLVEQGKDIRAQDELNRTPLHRAAGGNHKQICEWLLDNGSMPDLDHKDDSGHTPADEATFFNHSELASWLKKVQMTDKLRTALKDEVKDERQISSLLNSGADPNIKDKLGFPALVNAAMHSPALVSLFLEAGADVNTKTRKGERAVHWASYYGRLDVLQLLMDNKANLRVQDNYSMTPLHWAKLGNQNEAFEWLLKQNGYLDPSHKDDFDRTPSDWAEEVRNIKRSALHREAAQVALPSTSTQKQMCSPLPKKRKLEPGLDKARYNKEDSKDLYKAASKEDQGGVQTLINKGTADINWKSAGGVTPLHIACLHGNQAFVELLLSAGADRGAIANMRGATPLKWARKKGDKNIIKLLLPDGAEGEGCSMTSEKK